MFQKLFTKNKPLPSAPSMPPPTRNLLETKRTLGANIEFTTYCNLKCVYCAVQKPDYQWQHLDLQFIDSIVDNLTQRNILEITVSGHGETTQVPDWNRHCDAMIARGCKLNIITNLSKALDEDEIETFSRFNSVLISIDSVDAQIFKSIRRGSDLRTVLYNMARITACAHGRGDKGPRLGWTTVVNESNIFGLVDIVHFGLAQNVRFFSFCNIVIYPSNTFFRHITEMDESDKQKIPAALEALERVLGASGVEYDITAGVRESVKAIADGNELSTMEDKANNRLIYRKDYNDQKDMTRDCIDPWNLAFVSSDGTVKPCFVTNESLGKLGDGNSLSDMLEGQTNKSYREGLISGNLRDVCKNCHCKGWTTTEKLQERVVDYLETYDPVLS